MKISAGCIRRIVRAIEARALSAFHQTRARAKQHKRVQKKKQNVSFFLFLLCFQVYLRMPVSLMRWAQAAGYMKLSVTAVSDANLNLDTIIWKRAKWHSTVTVTIRAGL